MAGRRSKKKVEQVEVSMVAGVGDQVKKDQTSQGKWQSAGWALLLVGGLAHMLPEQMAPILGLAGYGVTVQMVVGTLSVIAALYFLLGE
jgi:hypothetical protein